MFLVRSKASCLPPSQRYFPAVWPHFLRLRFPSEVPTVCHQRVQAHWASSGPPRHIPFPFNHSQLCPCKRLHQRVFLQSRGQARRRNRRARQAADTRHAACSAAEVFAGSFAAEVVAGSLVAVAAAGCSAAVVQAASWVVARVPALCCLVVDSGTLVAYVARLGVRVGIAANALLVLATEGSQRTRMMIAKSSRLLVCAM